MFAVFLCLRVARAGTEAMCKGEATLHLHSLCIYMHALHCIAWPCLALHYINVASGRIEASTPADQKGSA